MIGLGDGGRAGLERHRKAPAQVRQGRSTTAAALTGLANERSKSLFSLPVKPAILASLTAGAARLGVNRRVIAMHIFDCHSHWSTERGYVFRTPEEMANQVKVWNTPAYYETEDEMAATLRRNKVRAVLDLAITMWMEDFDQVRALHDYAFAVQKKHRDVIFGHWLTFDPRVGKTGIKEFERARAANAGFVGFGIVGQQNPGFPPSDPIWDPFYKASIDAKVPVLIHTGLTGIGQGMRGGKGLVLDHAHPRHVDLVAARFPDLDILAARPAYPWQDEMIAILLHKGNVKYELHGWSPKHFSATLKAEIGGRLQDRVMFGCDYPVLKYEMMADRWRQLGYSDDVLSKVFHRNAEAYFPSAAP